MFQIEILGQTPERSFEDRSVYVNIKSIKKPLKSITSSSIESDFYEITTWLDGEKAIELGQMFIEQGKFALEANMINHQNIHMSNTFKRFLDDDILKWLMIIQ